MGKGFCQNRLIVSTFFFSSRRVTAQAVAIISDAFFTMLMVDFPLVMTGIAGPGCQTIRVTGGASIATSMIHWKTVGSVI